MNKIDTKFASDDLLARAGGSEFNALIAYDNRSSGLRAMQAFTAVIERLNMEFLFDPSLWSMDALEIPELRAVAAQEACDASIVLCSLEGNRPAPKHFKSWLNMWIHRTRRHDAALAVCVAPEFSVSKTGVEITDCLERCANLGGLEFVNQNREMGRSAENTLKGLQLRAERSSSVLEGILNCPTTCRDPIHCDGDSM